MGADAPSRLDPPDRFNEKGYWESAAIREFSDRILKEGGSCWDHWTEFTAPTERHKQEAQLAQIIQQDYGSSDLFVIKDPRLCRIAPILLGALQISAVEPRIVIPVRNPLETAYSLLQRDGIPVGEGLLLWLRHMLDAEFATRQYRRSIISFDDLLANFQSVVDQITMDLDLAWPDSTSDPKRKISEFVSEDLRHHNASEQDIRVYEQHHQWFSTVYRILLGCRREQASSEDLQQLDHIRAGLNTATSLVRFTRDHTARAELNATLGHLASAQERLNAAQERLNALTAQRDAARAELSASRVRVATAQTQIDALSEERSTLSRELVRFRVELHKAERKRLKPKPDAAARVAGVAKLFRPSKDDGGSRDTRQADLIRASGLFDADWYLRQYPDVCIAGMDPALHYIRHGAAEGRDPSEHFSTEGYLRRYLDVAVADMNPLVHFLEHGIRERRHADGSLRASDGEGRRLSGPSERVGVHSGLTEEHVKYSKRGEHYEDFDPEILAGQIPDVKLLAFFLPQFHAIPENDTFWGKGFTEWRQIARGLPRFPGHYQPRIPRDLGFYDLGDTSVLRRQVELAKGAGIHGFGFYYYRFDGLRVLEKPIENLLASSDIAMPFMLIWANENWTRTWDGMNGEMLLTQTYSLKEETATLADLARHFADARYIRLGDRPLFVIYQPRHVPDARTTFARWRARWRNEFGVDPAFFMAQTFGSEDPRMFGLDGAMEFPPHKLTSGLPGRKVSESFHPAFAGRVLSYDDVVAASLREKVPPFPLIKTAIPSWDNEPRRPMRGTTIEGASPGKYLDWLSQLLDRAKMNPVMGESIVAINAWNEWAEGAYLEPDIYYGSAYLNATAQAVRWRCATDACSSISGEADT
jgi:hypothetical protein